MSKIFFLALAAIVFCALYLVGRLARRVLAWGNNEPGPKERVSFYLVVFGLMGAFAGWLAYDPYLTILQCQAAGQPLVTCAFFPH